LLRESVFVIEIDRLYNSGFNKYPATFKKRIAKNFYKGTYIKDETFTKEI
jgi:hypothetical protein